MMKLLYQIIGLIIIALIFTGVFIHPAWAGGRRASFYEVVLEDLKIGRIYTISEEKKENVLSIENSSEKTMNVKAESAAPLDNEIKEGYEVIPDLSWIKVMQDTFTLRPQEKANYDVTISIPDNREYLGKKYQVMVQWRADGEDDLFTGIRSLIFFHISGEEDAKPSLGLSARPGTYLFSKIPVGERYELPLPLWIENKSDKERTYLLYTYKESQKSGAKQVEGYSDMLDPNWLFFERHEITIEADGIYEVKMYSDIPDNDSYYNQHWVIGLGVEGRPGEGEGVNLAVYPRYFLETESKDVLAAKPYGLIGIKPSSVTLKDVPLRKIERMAQILIFNNDYIPRQYQIFSAISPKDQERGIFVSPSYSWIPDPNWVIPEQKELSIDESQSETIAVGLNIPLEDRNRGKRWESLLMVSPDQGQPRFVRIQITTKK